MSARGHFKPSNAAKTDYFREKTRPFYLLKPKVFPDGNQWCALYGENLQDGVAGFGDTPNDAAKDFDREWEKGILPPRLPDPGR